MNVTIGTTIGPMGFNSGPVDIPRHKHRLLIGATGSGKSTLLRRLIHADLLSGEGLCLIDPHGSLGDYVLEIIPKTRINDVVVIDPLDQRPVGLNPVSHKTRVEVREVIEIMSRIYGDNSFLGRSTLLAENFGYAGAEVIDDFTLWNWYLMFFDSKYRKEVFSLVKDPAIRIFGDFFDEVPERTQTEAVMAPGGKMDALLATHELRHMLCQKATFDFQRAMDERKIVIVQGRIGELGEQVAALLGSIVIHNILHSAMKRTDASTQFNVYIDEAHTMSRGNRLDRILSETRKRGISLTIADQNIAQLPPGSGPAIFANVSTILVGRVGAEDAEQLGNEINTPNPLVLTQLQTGEWMTNGNIRISSNPLQTKTDKFTRRKAIDRSRIRYGTRRELIEQQLHQVLTSR